MSAPLRLVIFDVDGTLVDSQSDIVAAMTKAFVSVDAVPPDRKTILGIVGLSLDVALPQLAPDMSGAAHVKMVEAYKNAYMAQRSEVGEAKSSPIYPGAHATLRALHDIPELLLGVATGKSRRGLDRLIAGHGFEGLFVTQQVADHHPSKPHPSMILQAMSDVGVEPDQTIMVGDTCFDMEMAASAGVRSVAVTWGYHDNDRLAGATRMIDNFEALAPALNDIWGNPA